MHWSSLEESEVVTEDMPPDRMRKVVVVKYNLDAGGITLEDVASYRQFLSSILEIPQHLLVLISVNMFCKALSFGAVDPRGADSQGGVEREEVWRELWRRKVEGIEVADKNFDLLYTGILYTDLAV